MSNDKNESYLHKEDFPSQNEKLVKWAEEKFGGVTSFTTIRNPMKISLTGIQGETYMCNLDSISINLIFVCIWQITLILMFGSDIINMK